MFTRFTSFKDPFVVPMAIHESLCVVARPRPTWYPCRLLGLLRPAAHLISATLLQLFGRLHIKAVLSPLVISVWSLSVSSNSHLFRTILPADRTTAQPTRSRLLRASLPQRRQSSFPQPNLLASCLRGHHHGHVHAVCFIQGPICRSHGDP